MSECEKPHLAGATSGVGGADGRGGGGEEAVETLRTREDGLDRSRRGEARLCPSRLETP